MSELMSESPKIPNENTSIPSAPDIKKSVRFADEAHKSAKEIISDRNKEHSAIFSKNKLAKDQSLSKRQSRSNQGDSTKTITISSTDTEIYKRTLIPAEHKSIKKINEAVSIFSNHIPKADSSIESRLKQYWPLVKATQNFMGIKKECALTTIRKQCKDFFLACQKNTVKPGSPGSLIGRDDHEYVSRQITRLIKSLNNLLEMMIEDANLCKTDPLRRAHSTNVVALMEKLEGMYAEKVFTKPQQQGKKESEAVEPYPGLKVLQKSFVKLVQKAELTAKTGLFYRHSLEQTKNKTKTKGAGVFSEDFFDAPGRKSL